MLVIFDWDGTLCDSVDDIVQAMRAAAQELGTVTPDAAAVRDIVGLGLPQAIGQLFPELSGSDREKVAEAYSRQYVKVAAGPAILFEGAREMLAQLRTAGCELAVATGKSRRGLDRVLSGLGMSDYFDSSRCADETRSKPDPLMLLQILAERGRYVTEAIMIGDSEYDLEMAASVGMSSIGVSYGVHSPDRLLRHGPRQIISHLSELPDLLL
ncbi:MAG: HAD family hydrolase [Parahaliea sp.]